MANTTNKTRNAEILDSIESDLWRAVDERNDVTGSRFQNKWERDAMVVGRWFNLMVECGKFDEEDVNSEDLKDAVMELWQCEVAAAIKAQAAVFYDALEDSGMLDAHDEIMDSFYREGASWKLFSVRINEAGDDVDVAPNEKFHTYADDFIGAYEG